MMRAVFGRRRWRRRRCCGGSARGRKEAARRLRLHGPNPNVVILSHHQVPPSPSLPLLITDSVLRYLLGRSSCFTISTLLNTRNEWILLAQAALVRIVVLAFLFYFINFGIKLVALLFLFLHSGLSEWSLYTVHHTSALFSNCTHTHTHIIYIDTHTLSCLQCKRDSVISLLQMS